ncbi:MAG TPA: phosphate ABC transporter substrate-binding protein [Desulfosalsimonadaceae bacterium]|nr:phosphate ABC transporter substrate-binding protein [Desulfosalsimonadaceae bacterium]
MMKMKAAATACRLGAAVFLVLVLATAGWAQKLQIKGSTTVLPIAQKAAEEFMKIYPDVNVTVSGGGSGNGIKALIDGNTDIADASRFIKQEEVKMAVDNGAYPVPFAVARDCIVPVVHPSNPIEDLSLAQLKKIYQGKVQNWEEVGGEDREIVVISRDTSSGTYEVWEEIVLDGGRVYPGALLQASNGAVAQAVAKNKFAIGYVGLSYINKDLKAISVDGEEASIENAVAYPVSRELFMFTRGWPSGATMKFISYILHPKKGQELVAETGYVPLY